MRVEDDFKKFNTSFELLKLMYHVFSEYDHSTEGDEFLEIVKEYIENKEKW